MRIFSYIPAVAALVGAAFLAIAVAVLTAGLMERGAYTQVGRVLTADGQDWAPRREKLKEALPAVEGLQPAQISLIIDDDGPGIDKALREQVLNRGTRADEIQPGQGIGLAMVHELVGAYSGKLSIGDSAWGGESIRLELHS